MSKKEFIMKKTGVATKNKYIQSNFNSWLAYVISVYKKINTMHHKYHKQML